MEQLRVSIGPDEMLAVRQLAGLDADDSAAEEIATLAMRQGLADMLAKAGLRQLDAVGDVGSGSTEQPDRGREGSTELSKARPSTLAVLWDRNGVRFSVLGMTGAVLLVLLVGGYGARWSWTGFSGNNQVWDWLHLLLLPIAFGTFPLWLKYGGYMSGTRKLVFATGLVAFAGFVAAGYLVPLEWTGFPGNTLWDWLTLLVLPLALVTVRMWPTTTREIRPSHIVLATALGLGWVATLIGGYGGDWSWTGYPGNTLWDWLSLLLGPVVITSIVVPACVRWVSGDVVRIVESDERNRAQARRTSSETAAGRSVPATADRSGAPRR